MPAGRAYSFLWPRQLAVCDEKLVSVYSVGRMGTMEEKREKTGIGAHIGLNPFTPTGDTGAEVVVQWS